jgi:hypothetical protein
MLNRWQPEIAIGSPAQSVKTGDQRTRSEHTSVPTLEFHLVDDACAESFPASDRSAWLFQNRKEPLKHGLWQ